MLSAATMVPVIAQATTELAHMPMALSTHPVPTAMFIAVITP